MEESASSESEKFFLSPQYLPGFLAAYKSYPCLWNSKYPGGTYERSKAWEALVEYCKASIPNATEKWLKCRMKSVKSSFNKESRKVRLNPEYKPKLWYYKHMLSLKPDDDGGDAPSSKSRRSGRRDSKDSENNHQNENDSDTKEEDLLDEDLCSTEIRIESTFSTQKQEIGNFPHITQEHNLPVEESDNEDSHENHTLQLPTKKSKDPTQLKHLAPERDSQDQEKRCKLIERATKELYKKSDVYEAYGQIIESKLRNLANLDFNQYLHAERLINDAIYRAFQRQLTPNTTIIECQPQFVSQPSGTNVFPPQQNVCPNPTSYCPPYSQPGPVQNGYSSKPSVAVPVNPGGVQSVETGQGL